MASFESVGDVLRAVFRLEAERVVCAARLGRVPGAEAMMEDVDTRLGAAFAALEEANTAYPLHMVARRYRLTQEDYLVLQLALLSHHHDGDVLIAAVTDALGDAAPRIRLSHALALIAEGFDDWERAKAELETFPIFREKLVLLEPDGDGSLDDPHLAVSLAVLELAGLE